MLQIGLYSSAVPKLKQQPTTFKIRLYPLIDETVENGVDYGWNRAHKHTDTPSEEVIKDAIHQAVMSALCELIDFEVAEE
jgi:hypothetical protein